MKKLLKKFFNKKRWNEIKTRKVMLIFSAGMVLTYTIVAIVLLTKNFLLNDQLTIEYFGYAKWIVAAGAGITIAKVWKGSTNSDNDESSSEEEINNE